MRSRIMSALVATAAAGATATTLGLAAAGTANASVATTAQPAPIGTSIGSTSSAGYEASGRDFRYISSTITVPDTDFLTGFYPSEYIQLSNGSLTQPTGGGNAYTRAGIEPCVVAQGFGDTCTTGTWVAFVEAFNNSLSGPFFRHFFNLAGVNQGDGVNFSIYYNEVGNELSYVITPPSTSDTPKFYKTGAHGAIFDHAAALDDFTNSTGTPIALPPFIHSFRINQFLQGAITTENGARGSFTGPWTTSMVIATSNGLLPPSGATRVSPSALWTDGLPANGAVRANDAFGVWAR
jgi:hypothetical protein